MKCNPQKIVRIRRFLIAVLVLLCMAAVQPSAEAEIPKAASPIDGSGAAGVGEPNFPQATQLQSVYAARQGKGMKVFVGADGMIKDYKAFTIDDPPRIVFDLFNLKSPYDKEKIISVKTDWVDQIRYAGESDKVRLVLNTKKAYLTGYEAVPVENGLLIQIGTGANQLVMKSVTAPAQEAAAVEKTAAENGGQKAGKDAPAAKRSTVQRAANRGPAAVDQIEFIGTDAGKSTLVVGTTRPVKYDARKIDDNRLELRLLNARLPDDRERPLITDRFESAVDEIIPKTRPAGGNTVLFDIKLREGVPYVIEQDGNTLKVNFAASTVPPKPLTGMMAAEKTVPVSPPSVVAGGAKNQDQTSPAGSGMAPVLPSVPKPPPAAPSDLNLDFGEELGIIEDLPVYTGEKIALDFYETDIKNVFRILREVSNTNFAIDKDVTGKVTLTLAEPVPWDHILDLVLKMNKLGKTVEGNIIRIATRATLAEEARLRQEKRTAELAARDQQQQLEPLYTEYMPVNYSNANREIKPHIEKLLTKDRGNVSVDERTNMIIITDTAEKIRKTKELISKLDRVTPQVLIEGRVVEATTNFSKEIGTTWQMGIGVQQTGTGVEQTPDSSAINIGGATDVVTDTVNNRVGTGPQRGYNDLGGTYGYNMAVDFPIAASDFGSIGFNFMRIAGTPFLLNAKLHAMESQGEAKIISAPKVVTLDNKKAVIKQGVSYPYQTVEDGEVKVEFKDVDLLLEVTPHVTPDNRISMSINITKNDLGDVISGQQSFTTKEAQTELLVNDGDTVVIGGIIKTVTRQNMEGIPYLNKVPILGWLFKAEGADDQKEELLIFITPKIIQLEQRLVQF